MSSSLATASTAASATILSGTASGGGGGNGSSSSGSTNTNATCVAQFREIHKNTWLKRLTADGKKITVGPKKSDRTWVVFCVHDDTEALLEGYAEPRQAGSHSPEWTIRLQDTLHISHALFANSHEFEFVVTLSNEVMRFHAMSWEIMQEWVETLRSKLREMKILSPRENLYTKLPEIRAPLAPTRDPTSPLPAPPPVPAALVPGTEIVTTTAAATAGLLQAPEQPTADSANTAVVNNSRTHSVETPPSTSSSSTLANASTSELASSSSNGLSATASGSSPQIFTAMSNTLTQNLLNMLSDPISAYSEQLHDEQRFKHDFDDDTGAGGDDDDDEDDDDDDDDIVNDIEGDNHGDKSKETLEANISKELSAKFNHGNLLRGGLENSVRLDVALEHRVSADHLKNLSGLLQCERLIPRPHTSRSMSAGAADKSRKHKVPPLSTNKTKPSKDTKHQVSTTTVSSSPSPSAAVLTCASTSNSNNITELEVSPITINHLPSTSAPTSSNLCVNNDADDDNDDDDADAKTNITIIQVSESAEAETETSAPPMLPMKSLTAEVFKFPESDPPATSTTSITFTKPQTQHEYKSNVQIIPSNANSSTIQVLSGASRSSGMHVSTTVANQYSSPLKKQHTNKLATSSTPSPAATTKAEQKFVTENPNANNVVASVHAISVYGTCYTPPSAANGPASREGTPKMPKKIILSANTSGVTNISVNNDTSSSSSSHKAAIRALAHDNGSMNNSSNTNNISNVKHNTGNIHYEKVFLSSSIPIAAAQEPSTANMSATNETPVTAVTASSTALLPPRSPKWNCARRQSEQGTPKVKPKASVAAAAATTSTPATPSQTQRVTTQRLNSPSNNAVHNNHVTPQPPLPTRPPLLTRGLTEAVISTRPSRKDFHFLKLTPAKTKSHSGNNGKPPQHSGPNNNAESAAHTNATQTNDLPSQQQQQHAAVNRTNSESLEHRRRSSSTSDARNMRSTNNNEHHPRNYGGGGGSGVGPQSGVLRIQQPPHVSAGSAAAANNSSPSSKRMTLREQQVMQLRREIMHPGGVRLQLRRKDCIGSIAWVDAFGAVWVAGWKQKECPVLYNALHIGDQLLSIAGVTISSAAEANKIIRNSNTLFVEMLVRRIPFGRGYAIRRDREGQCLGLIRDGNTSTIVDVVPNSLAARHGLPPKAQSCDGASLTFWVLTEINGRPLNLFFKENEIRDRLNSVGRDISILVQPADLIAKLKKQLKSLRGYKDYLVQ